MRLIQVPGKIGQIICTGNVSDKETYDYLRTIAPEVNVVRGEFDEVCEASSSATPPAPLVIPAEADAFLRVQNTHFPLSLTIPHQSLRIGVVHGQQIVPAGDTDMLAALARQMDVDVLISGGTHRSVRPHPFHPYD